MPDTTRTSRLIGRICALSLLGLAIAYGIGATRIEYAFSSDPLGPRAMPIALAILLGVFSLIYLYRPGDAECFPSGRLLLKILCVPLLLVVSVALFEPAGFAASIFILTLGTGMIFGAPLTMALIGAIGHAALWWALFVYLLDVYLPAGTLFG